MKEAEENKVEGDNEDDNNDGEQMDTAKVSRQESRGQGGSETAGEPNCFATIQFDKASLDIKYKKGLFLAVRKTRL